MTNKLQRYIGLSLLIIGIGLLFVAPAVGVILVVLGIILAKKKKKISPENAVKLKKILFETVGFEVKKGIYNEPYQREPITMIQAKNTILGEKPEFQMKYTDAYEKKSFRKIILKNIEMNEENLYLNAFCLLVNENRMFRVDRINQITYKKEIIPSPIDYFLDIFTSSIPYKIHEFITLHEDLLKLFVFLARSDGRMAKNEREIICNYVKNSLPEAMDKAIETELKQIEVINLVEFNKLLKQLENRPESVKADILNYTNQIIQCKKNPDVIEQAIYNKIQAVIKQTEAVL
jgi:hypothetical protein